DTVLNPIAGSAGSAAGPRVGRAAAGAVRGARRHRRRDALLRRNANARYHPDAVDRRARCGAGVRDGAHRPHRSDDSRSVHRAHRQGDGAGLRRADQGSESADRRASGIVVGVLHAHARRRDANQSLRSGLVLATPRAGRLEDLPCRGHPSDRGVYADRKMILRDDRGVQDGTLHPSTPSSNPRNHRMSVRGSIARFERLLLLLGAAALCAGCASAPASRSRAPSARSVAAINADLRMVGSETTWVVLHTGFELVARSKADMPVLASSLDDEARTFRIVFNTDPPDLVVTVRHPTSAGYGLQSAAPLPEGTTGTVVEVELTDPSTARGAADDSRSGGRGSYGGRGGRTGGRQGGDADAGPATNAAGTGTMKVVRAWLSAHATVLTGQPASTTVRSGQNDDVRIAPWIEDGLPALLAGIPRETQLTTQLGTHTDSLIPLRTFLTMARPPFVYTPSSSAPMGGGAGSGGMGGGMG